MGSFSLIILTVLILFVTVIFHAGVLLDFIRPSVLQIQLLGVHLTLFGIMMVLVLDGSSGFGFTIGLVGLFTGVVGSFREPNRPPSDDK